MGKGELPLKCDKKIWKVAKSKMLLNINNKRVHKKFLGLAVASSDWTECKSTLQEPSLFLSPGKWTTGTSVCFVYIYLLEPFAHSHETMRAGWQSQVLALFGPTSWLVNILVIAGYQTQLKVKPLFLLKFSVFSHKGSHRDMIEHRKL
jgi:hypothetical protein